MGRPSLGAEKRDLSIKVAFNEQEASDIYAAAKENGLPVARFIREAAIRATAESRVRPPTVAAPLAEDSEPKRLSRETFEKAKHMFDQETLRFFEKQMHD